MGGTGVGIGRGVGDDGAGERPGVAAGGSDGMAGASTAACLAAGAVDSVPSGAVAEQAESSRPMTQANPSPPTRDEVFRVFITLPALVGLGRPR